ncbi:MAG: peptidase U32 family protein [Bacillota bacterium]
MNKPRKPELLAPAGDLEKLQAAVLYGADAVYLGGKSFGLRARAGNFDLEEMRRGIDFAHSHGVAVYVTVNIFAHQADLRQLPVYLRAVQEAGADALIVADPGVLDLAREITPRLPVHLSTQANTTNSRAVRFWAGQGVKRVVLARELSLDEIREIRRENDVELEVFVHGAMCMAYSGRCLLSNYLTGRDANRGDCAQACRWRYALCEEKRPGEYMPVYEDERGSYILSSRDLCLLPYLPQLIAAGVDSLKIEGRVKSVHYVATVVAVYRQAIDSYWHDPAAFQVRPEWLDELGKVSNRDYTSGFLLGGDPGAQHNELDNIYRRPYTFVGLVKEYDPPSRRALVQQRNPFACGQELEALLPGGTVRRFSLVAMHDAVSGESIGAAPHPCQEVWIQTPFELPPFSLLRRAAQV